MSKLYKFNTKVIHAGVEPEPTTGAIMTPIYQTSTYVQQAPGIHKGFEYSRTQNPTRQVLENNLAAIENGRFGLAFSSGLAAMDAIVKLLSPGDEVISTDDLYGGSYRLLTKVFQNYGIGSSFVSMSTNDYVKSKITNKTKLLWLETPTNPMLNIIDIKKMVKLAQGKDIIVVVDNTFASPYLQNPLDLGADIVLHSATKYLGGHSDVVLGALVVKDEKLAKRLYFIQNATGAVPGPMDSFLVLRGIKTLHLRVERGCKNAKVIAHYLKAHPKVKNVYYPGFKNHPNHKLAKTQMSGFGAIISFDLVSDTIEDAHKILKNTHLFALAESLGGVESLIGHPSSMTHASIPRKDRLKIGLTDSLVRLSIGVEDVEDLIDDLENAFANL